MNIEEVHEFDSEEEQAEHEEEMTSDGWEIVARYAGDEKEFATAFCKGFESKEAAEQYMDQSDLICAIRKDDENGDNDKF